MKSSGITQELLSPPIWMRMEICDWEAESAEQVKEIVEKVLDSSPVNPVIVVKKVL